MAHSSPRGEGCCGTSLMDWSLSQLPIAKGLKTKSLAEQVYGNYSGTADVRLHRLGKGLKTCTNSLAGEGCGLGLGKAKAVDSAWEQLTGACTGLQNRLCNKERKKPSSTSTLEKKWIEWL